MVIIMNALFLVITVISLTVQSVFKKAYLGKKSSVFLFNSLTGLAAAAVFFVFAKGKFDFCAEIFPYIISFAVCFIVCMFSSFMAIKTGSLALTSLVISYSLVIPTLYGIIFRKDPTNLLFYIGISLLILSLFLVNFEKGEKKITKKWLIFIVIAFFCNGLCSTIQSSQQIKHQGLYKSEFMFTVYMCLAVIMAITSLIREKKSKEEYLNKYNLFAILSGVANGVTNLFVMVLSTRMPTSVLFPIISAGSILATAAISFFVYKERFSKLQILGILMGTASIVCLNI
jgi:drug/metabolite transporter (DMT)-like permease